MSTTIAKPAAKPGLLKRIIIDIETDVKHIVLDIPEAETFLAEIAAATGSTKAKTAAAILGLAQAAVTAYEDAGNATITPEEIGKLLPDATPLAAPAAAAGAGSKTE